MSAIAKKNLEGLYLVGRVCSSGTRGGKPSQEGSGSLALAHFFRLTQTRGNVSIFAYIVRYMSS
jgi:hypothetical protein